MKTLLWLEYRRSVNFIRYSLTSGKRLVVGLIFAASLVYTISTARHMADLDLPSFLTVIRQPEASAVMLDVGWTAIFFFLSLVFVSRFHQGLDSRFTQLSASDRDFLLPAPVPGHAILLARALRLSLLWGAFLLIAVVAWRHQMFQFVGQTFGITGWSFLAAALFAALVISVTALVFSLKNILPIRIFIQVFGWSALIALFYKAYTLASTFYESIIRSQVMHLSRQLDGSWMSYVFFPSFLTTDALVPYARPNAMPPELSVLLLMACTVFVWLAVIRTAGSFYDPPSTMSRMESVMLVLRSMTGGAHTRGRTIQPVLGRLAYVRLPIARGPLAAIVSREFMLSIRRLLPLVVSGALLLAGSLGVARIYLSRQLDSEPTDVVMAIGMLVSVYLAIIFAVTHEMATRNRAGSLYQDALLPIQPRNRALAQVLPPAICYTVSIFLMGAITLAIASTGLSPFSITVFGIIASLLLAGTALTHLGASLFPGTDPGDIFLSMLVIGPLAMICIVFIAVCTTLAVSLTGPGINAGFAAFFAGLLCAMIICHFLGKILPDPTASGQE